MSVIVTIRGLDELKRTLNGLPKKLKNNIMRGAVRAGATVIADEARRLVPMRSGQLKHSIRLKTIPTKTGVTATVSVGSRDTVYRKGRTTKTPYKRLTTGGRVQYSVAYYAYWVEFGTKPHRIKIRHAKALTVPGTFARAPFRKSVMHPGAKANPFMHNAARSKGQAALQRAVDYAVERINGLNQGGQIMNIATDEGRQMVLPGLPVPAAEPFHTDNPREIRIICALACGPRTREQLDNIAGASNVPDAIAALRRKGLDIPACREPVVDRDREVVYRGRYRFTDADLQRTRAIWEV